VLFAAKKKPIADPARACRVASYRLHAAQGLRLSRRDRDRPYLARLV
jgi:hypothetical protein